MCMLDAWEEFTMPTIDQAASLHTDPAPKLPKEWPHGLITPPTRVREFIEQERAKHPAEVFAKHEVKLLSDWTIGFTFNGTCLEVVYRVTPLGPDVLAVGLEEVVALRKTMPRAELMNLETYLGYE
jgi:hypothetical protein